MKIVTGDIWDFYKEQHWICITTNGFVKSNGDCVMGRGTAMQAARKFPRLPYQVGKLISRYGNVVHALDEFRLITLPVKDFWYNNADMSLIVKSARQLVKLVDRRKFDRVYLPKPGCGNGNLSWSVVYPAIKTILDDDRFIIVDYKKI